MAYILLRVLSNVSAGFDSGLTVKIENYKLFFRQQHFALATVKMKALSNSCDVWINSIKRVELYNSLSCGNIISL